MKKPTLYYARAAMTAAVYVVLTGLAAGFDLASGAVQVRFSEALTILPFFTPAAVPGLTIGCLLSNILFSLCIWPGYEPRSRGSWEGFIRRERHLFRTIICWRFSEGCWESGWSFLSFTLTTGRTGGLSAQPERVSRSRMSLNPPRRRSSCWIMAIKPRSVTMNPCSSGPGSVIPS